MLTMLTMSRNSSKMNDILSQSTASSTHPHFSNLSSMGSNSDQIVPMVRSMSDASEFMRRSNPANTTRIFGNFNCSRMEQLLNMSSSPSRVTSSQQFASSSSVSDGNESNGSSMFISANNNQNQLGTSVQSAPVEDEDFDLNMVFDEIGALQNKGLDESEDDIVPPLQLGSTLQQMQQQHHQPGTSTQPQSSTTSMGHYNRELYDEADLSLVNEKYLQNVR